MKRRQQIGYVRAFFSRILLLCTICRNVSNESQQNGQKLNSISWNIKPMYGIPTHFKWRNCCHDFNDLFPLFLEAKNDQFHQQKSNCQRNAVVEKNFHSKEMPFIAKFGGQQVQFPKFMNCNWFPHNVTTSSLFTESNFINARRLTYAPNWPCGFVPKNVDIVGARQTRDWLTCEAHKPLFTWSYDFAIRALKFNFRVFHLCTITSGVIAARLKS